MTGPLACKLAGFVALVLMAGEVCTWTAFPALHAQARRLVSEPPATERRLALVIGNAAYAAQPLANPANDARAMAAALKETGFDVSLSLDTTFRDLSRVVDQFVDKLGAGDVALVYYSGHGIQVEGENFLLPVDFEAKDEADAKYVSYSASRLHDRVSGRGVRLKILILDACRNNPFRTSRSTASGLAQMAAGQGSFIGLATGPGSTADDNPTGKNGLFTGALLAALKQPGLGLEQVFYNVRQEVFAASKGAQTPWSNSSVIGEFYFKPSATATAMAPTNTADILLREELLFWESIKDGRNARWFEEYLTRYGANGRFSMIARERVAELSAATKVAPPPATGPASPGAVPNSPSNLRLRAAEESIGGSALSAIRLRQTGIADVNSITQTRLPRELMTTLVASADGLVNGRAPVGAGTAIWHHDTIKAAGNLTYVPFTLIVDPSTRPAGPRAIYWRVVAIGSTDGKAAYEDVTSFDAPPPDRPYRLSRSFAVPPGDYDVFIVMRDTSNPSGSSATLLEMKQRVAVPSYLRDELSLSTVILANTISEVPAPLSNDEARSRPYTFGTTAIVPASTTSFSRTEEISSLFFIYGTASPDDRSPDVLVEFAFYRTGPDGDRYFNRTEPVRINSQTLPAGFSLKAHQLTAGNNVPLKSFTPGEYRLEIKVTDQRRKVSVTRDVRFMVEA